MRAGPAARQARHMRVLTTSTPAVRLAHAAQCVDHMKRLGPGGTRLAVRFHHEAGLSHPSLSAPDQRYIGVTSNLGNRLRTHNAGASPHTSKYAPWELVTYICFANDQRALEFERYLKSGSGHAFANKRLW
jgi:putative endonuclease